MSSDFVNLLLGGSPYYPAMCKPWAQYYPTEPKPLPVIKFKKLSPSAIIPEKKTAGAACWDLFSLNEEYLKVGVKVVDTGIAIELPPGCVGMVCSRSGLAAKQGIFVANAPGVIDEDYRGELKVIVARMWVGYSHMMEEFISTPAGSRIAQLMVLPLQEYRVEIVDELSTTARGEGGLGSTGL